LSFLSKDEGKIKMTINVMQLIDRATASMRMSKVSAIQFLERIEVEIESRKKLLREEIVHENS